MANMRVLIILMRVVVLWLEGEVVVYLRVENKTLMLNYKIE
jgi:hypothetical protein